MPSWLQQTMRWKRDTSSCYNLVHGEYASEKSSASSVEVPFLDSHEIRQIRKQTMPKRTAMTIIGFLSTLVLVLTILLLLQSPNKKRSPVPDFPYETKVFTPDDDWEWSPKTDELWNAVLPNAGLIAIENWQDYGLKPGLKTRVDNSLVYGVSVSHQFHCLNMIREYFYGLATQNQTYIDLLKTSTDFSQPMSPKVKHSFHCLDYLRQIILCNADTTLEWRSDVDHIHIDGYGPPHQCRNFDHVRSWMMEKLPPDERYQHPL